MRASIFSSILIASVISYSSAASAFGYTGLCVDNGSGGCTERLLPFNGSGYTLDFCEETCTLTNPVKVRDLNATLYDFECVADYEVEPNPRVMVLTQTDYLQNDVTLFIDKYQTRKIVKC